MEYNIYAKRRRQLAAKLDKDTVAVLRADHDKLRNGDTLYPFRQNSNFYYLCGINEPDLVMVLLIGKTVKEYLFIPRQNETRKSWEGEKVSLEKARALSGISNVFYLDEMPRMASAWLRHAKRVGIDDSYTPFIYNKDLPADPVVNLARMTAATPVQDISRHIHGLRVVKDADELELLRKAIAITRAGIIYLAGRIKPGMYEYQATAYLDALFTYLNGVHGFPPIVASGPNSTVLHYEKRNRQVKDRELLLLDVGAEYKGYSADISRTFAVGGLTKEQKALFDLVREAHAFGLTTIKPGISIRQVNEKIRDFQVKTYVKAGLGADAKEVQQVIMHNVSHFLGLDAHDVGDADQPLAPGMVLTLEPGLYLKDKGWGFRLEDDILVTEQGNENLSAAIPTTIEECAKIAANNFPL